MSDQAAQVGAAGGNGTPWRCISHLLLGAAIASALAWNTAASADDLRWSPTGQDSGGTGNWNTTDLFWFNGTLPLQAWTNVGANPHNAIFGGTAGTVDITSPVRANDLTFNTTGYTITSTGGTFTLGASGATMTDPTINVVAGGIAILDVPIAGNDGLIHAGSGTTILGQDNNYSGTTTISGGTLQIGNGGATGRISNNSDIVNNAALVFDRSEDLTYSGDISGNGTFTKNNTNFLTLSGNYTLKGDTTITGGTLQLRNGSVDDLIESDVHINSGSELNFHRTGATPLEYSGTADGAGTVEKTGGGTVIFTGENDYSGGTTISGGRLQIGDGGTSGSITGNVANSGTLAFNRSDTLTYGGVISGSGALRQDGTGTTILTGDNDFTGNTTISAGTLQVGDGDATGAIVGNIAVGNGTALVFNRNNTLTYGGALSGGGSLTQAGTGTTILTNNNGSFVGTTTISAGTLQVGDGGNSGSITNSSSIANNAALVFNRNSGNLNYAGAISGSGTLTKKGGNTLTLSGDNSLFTGLTTIEEGTLQIGNNADGSFVSDIHNDSALVFNRTGDTPLVYGGSIDGTGTVEKTGGGIVTFTGTNTYTGDTTISAGRLRGGATDAFSSASTHILTANTFLDLGGFDQTIGSLASTTNTNRVVTNSGGGATLTIGANNASTTFGGVIEGVAGAIAVTKVGGGKLTLTNNNSYTGTTTISAGILEIGDGGNSGSIASASIVNNAELLVNRTGTLILNGDISGSGTLTKNLGGTLTLTGNNTFAGPTTIDVGTLQIGDDGTTGSITSDILIDNNSVLRFSRSDALTYGGNISGSGTMTKQSAGTLTLTGTNTYTGTTTISAGTLRGGAENAFSAASTHTISANNTSLDLGGFDQTIGALASGNNATRVVTNSAATAVTLTTGANNASATFGGVIEKGAGTIALTKIGTGTQVLTGTNIYTGTTTISGGILQIGSGGSGSIASASIVNNAALLVNRTGTLILNGDISGTGTLTKNLGGTLTLTGDNTFAGLTTINAGTLQIGDGGTTGSIVSNILNNNALRFDRSDALSYGGAISGTGTLTKAGAGTLTLTGNNSFNGNTTVSAGTLLVNGTNANSAVTVSNGATLGGAGTVSTTTIGNGGMLSPGNSIDTFIVDGDLTFSGSSSNYLVEFEPPAANDLTNVAGIAFLAGTVTAIAAPGAYTADSYLILSAAGGINGTFADLVVQGSFGGLHARLTYDTNDVFLTLAEVNWTGAASTDWFDPMNWESLTVPTAADTTTIDTITPNPTVIALAGAESGELRIGNSAMGEGRLAIQNGGTLQTDGDALVGQNGGTGEVVVTGANSAWTVTGELRLGGNAGTAGNGRLTIGTGATVNVGNGGGTVHGNGNEAILSVEGGVLNAGRVALSDTTSVFFNHGLASYVFAPRITGTGERVSVGGGGTTIFTANNTYSGLTRIGNATLQIGNGGTTGAITGDVELVAGQGGRLVFNRSNTLTYGGTITGNGNVVQDGAGTTVLTGISTYTGTTTVNAGTLIVDGSIANSTVMVREGARLDGIGQLGALTVLSGGVVKPGDSIGTLTVNGAFILDPGATYEAEVNAAGDGDRVVVTGTVNLSGAVLRVLAENGAYRPRTEYLIVENDGTDAIVGEFAEVTANLAFLTPTVLYDGGTGNDVVLFLTRNDSDFCAVARTRNECAVARALDQFPVGNPLYLAVLQQSASGARQAFDALSGEIHGTLPGLLADDSRYVRETVLGRLTQAAHTNADGRVAALGTGGPQVASFNTGLDERAMALGSAEGKHLAPPSPSYGAAFWTRAYGAWGDFDGDGNAASADRDLGGFLSGIDAQISGTWRAGLAAGGAWSNVSVSDRRSRADIESFNLAGYVGGMAGPLALRGGGAWTWSDIDTNRAVVFPGFFERQSTGYDADTGQIFGEIAYPVTSGRLAFEPFAGLAYVDIDTDSFRERGGALSSLNGGSDDEDVGYFSLGLRAATVAHVANMIIVPKISAAWQHAFDDLTPGASLAFASTGIGFVVDGVPLAEDSVLLEAGLDLALSPTATLGVSYTGQFADSVSDNGVKGRFTWLF